MQVSFLGMGPSTQVSQPQRTWAMPAEVGRPVPLDDSLIAQCDTLLDAILLCVHMSRIPSTAIAKRLGIDPGHWTRILHGQAHFPTNKMKALMDHCRNLAPLQWQSRAMGVPLVIDMKEQRRAQLLRELALLEGPSNAVNEHLVAA